MNKIVLAVAAIGLTAGVALVQTQPAPSGSQERAAPTTQPPVAGGALSSMRIDVARVALGQRASKLIGATVVNSKDEKIGTIDDLVVNPDDRVTYAVVSVGGFLGIGNHLVAVPFQAFQNVRQERLMLPGATKEALKDLPEFKYARS